MIKVKEITGYYITNEDKKREYVNMESELNEFLNKLSEKNGELIDIKYTSVVFQNDIETLALVIYKTYENEK